MNTHFSPLNRRNFLKSTAAGLGSFALTSMLTQDASAGVHVPGHHFAPKAKRIIFLFMSGGPSQHDLFDYKPMLRKFHKKELFKNGKEGFIERQQRLTGMTSGQKSFPIAGNKWDFKQHGQSGAWVSDLMPNIAKISDDLCFVKSMYTEAINHDPGMTFFQTGAQIPGRPSFGSWMSYGLGSENKNLPDYSVMISQGSGRKGGQPIYTKLWGNGFLPSVHPILPGSSLQSGANVG